jgi:hypothetical protein
MARRLALLVVLPLVLAGCPKKKGDKSSDAGAAASASAPPVTSVTAASTAAASATAAAAAAKATEKAAVQLADIKATIAKGSKTKKPGNDVQVVCDTLESQRATATDPEHKKILDEAHELCSFDVPLYVAVEALDQMGKTPSQASVLLSCKVASRELAKAKAKKPTDKHYRDVDNRFKTVCPGMK